MWIKRKHKEGMTSDPFLVKLSQGTHVYGGVYREPGGTLRNSYALFPSNKKRKEKT